MISTRRDFGRRASTAAVTAVLGFATPPWHGLFRPAAESGSVHQFRFVDASGGRRRLADMPAKAFLLNFWATWCPPCIAEMPSLDRLQGLLTAEAIRVLPLSADSGGAVEVARFYQRHELRNLGIWLDRDGEAARSYAVSGLPTSVLTDASGREIARVEGAAQWDAPQVVATIRRLASGASAP